jgi:alpha-L-fucosidase
MRARLLAVGLIAVGAVAVFGLLGGGGLGPDRANGASAPAADATPLLTPKAPIAPGPFKPEWESLESQYRTPEWFRDAKFGIWAHWTAQCVPEQGDWYARRMYEEGNSDYKYHVEHYGHPSKFGFKDICNLWKAEKWEPEKLIQLYKRAGAKYFVALANHHCNFDCWDSKYQPWNTVNVGPHKDIVGGWAEAARRAGLRFGVTVHAARSWTWYEVAQGADKSGPLAGVPYDGKLTKADGKGKWWDGLDPQDLYAQNHKVGDKPDQAYVDKFFNRVKDLVEKYQPDLLYFDDGVMPLNSVSDAGLRIAANYYNSSIQWHGGRNEAVMTTKGLAPEQRKALVWDIERGRSDRLEPYPWQTDTCIGSWHYAVSVLENHRYKTATTVITTLIDIVSKNGNLLLNVPVKGDGTIDADEVKVLEDLARWMDVSSEAVFCTRPWVIFGEGGGDVSAGNFGERNARAYSATDIRFTCKGDTVYAFVLGWPEKPVVIRSMAKGSPLVKGDVNNVVLLGHEGKLEWSRTDSGLVINVPEKKPCESAYAFKITGLAANADADTSNLPYVPKPLPPAPAKGKAAAGKGKAAPGKAQVTPGKTVSQAADGTLKLGADAAETHGSRLKVEAKGEGGRPNLGFWDDAADWAAWKADVKEAGTFEVSITAAAGKGDAQFVLEVGPQQLAGKAPKTDSWTAYQTTVLGKVEIKQPGEVTIAVRPKDPASWKAINLTEVILKKAP